MAGLLAAQDEASLPRLHACFVDGDHAFVAVADPADSAPWPLGIPRLRLHADAPSRSALKLEEALPTLLDDRARARLPRAGSMDERRVGKEWFRTVRSRGYPVHEKKKKINIAQQKK